MANKTAVRNAIYGLTTKDGTVFYVGQASHLGKRIASYRAGRFHGNLALAEMVQQEGVNVVVLREDCEDMNAAEFSEIAAHDGLVNVITDPEHGFWVRRSTKPWVVKASHCPTTLYARFVRNSFGADTSWLGEALRKMNPLERMATERRFAVHFRQSPIGERCAKWLEAVDACA